MGGRKGVGGVRSSRLYLHGAPELVGGRWDGAVSGGHPLRTRRSGRGAGGRRAVQSVFLVLHQWLLLQASRYV
eukprot:565579-Prorocentrum_minimum.AAC.5